jgi:hypothetical protein
MFLRKSPRKKDGKTHEYWSVVENKRVAGGRVVQRHVLYLGEINSSQATAWRKAIEVLDDAAGRSRTLALFPEDRCAAAPSDASVVQLRLSEMRLCRPRQWGACWLAGQLWQALQLDQFWAARLPPSRKGTRWDQVLQVLVRSALEKFAAVQMIDVHLPTTDGRELLLTRYTEPEPELRLLIQQLRLNLPPQPPPRIATGRLPSHPLECRPSRITR